MLTYNLHSSSVDTVFHMWRSHVKLPLCCNVSCISVDVQPTLRISANLIPIIQTAEEITPWSHIYLFILGNRKTSRFTAISYLRSELSGSKAILFFSNVPGFTDSRTSICMGSSLKRGASFSFTTMTVTVAELKVSLEALLLGGLRFSTLKRRRYSLCAS